MSEARFIPLVSKLSTQAIAPDGKKVDLYAVHAMSPTSTYAHTVQIRTKEALDELQYMHTYNDFVRSLNRLGHLTFEVHADYLEICITDNETGDKYRHIGTAIHEYNLRCQLQFKQEEALLTPERNSLCFHRDCGWMPGTIRDSDKVKTELREELDAILSDRKKEAKAAGIKRIDTTDIVSEYQCMHRPREVVLQKKAEFKIKSDDKAIIPLTEYDVPDWFHKELPVEPTSMKRKEKLKSKTSATAAASPAPKFTEEKKLAPRLLLDTSPIFFPSRSYSSSAPSVLAAQETRSSLLDNIPACLIKVKHEFKNGNHTHLSFELENPTSDEINTFYHAIGGEKCTSKPSSNNQVFTIKPEYIIEILNKLGITVDSAKEREPAKQAVQAYAITRLPQSEWSKGIPGLGDSKSTKLAACLLYLAGKHEQSRNTKIHHALTHGDLESCITQATAKIHGPS